MTKYTIATALGLVVSVALQAAGCGLRAEISFAQARKGDATAASLFPPAPCKVSALHREGKVIKNAQGLRMWFIGTNTFHSHLEWSLALDYKAASRELAAIADQGFNLVRVPLNMSHVQPARGVFPNDTHYAGEMRRHNLDPQWIGFLDWLVDYAGGLGLYVILEFHELPTDPYRYFAGGDPKRKAENEPGGGVAWMSEDALQNGRPQTIEAIAEAHRFLSAHFRGHPAVAGIEVPFNEPHGEWWSKPQNYREAVVKCARAIKQADPSRLVFMGCESWGAGNANPTSTWDVPPQVDAVVPHFYLALHAPLALRGDPRSLTETARTYSAGGFAWALPFTACPVPVVLGEFGEAGGDPSVLDPDTAAPTVAARVVEHTVALSLAAGVRGFCHWAWGDENAAGSAGHLRKYVPLFQPSEEQPQQRYPEVVLIVKVSEDKVAGGILQGLGPISDVMLDAQVTSVRLVWEDELDQALRTDVKALDILWKARVIVVDKDVQWDGGHGLPDEKVFRCDFSYPPPDELYRHMASQGIVLNRKSPSGILLLPNFNGMILYHRHGPAGILIVYPLLERAGQFSLWGEGSSGPVFSGDAMALYEHGVQVEISQWQSTVLMFHPSQGQER